MTGFRLNDGSAGCPPTETPPSDYTIPFRFDSAGRLWITSCFKNLQYFGAARHDIGSQVGFIGDSAVGLAVSTDPDVVAGNGVTQGTATNLTVTNNTGCTLGFLLGHDIFVDLSTKSQNLVRWILSARVNGANYSISAASGINSDDASHFVRSQFTSSANPHNNGIEAGGANDLTLAPGASMVVGAKMFIEYVVGSPTGTEVVVSAASAVRVYGYVL